MTFYPLKFEPILKEKIWGGKKLSRLLNKKSDQDQIGESWELSGVQNNLSIIANGPLQGQSLQNLVEDYPSEVLGRKNYKRFGSKFPLLIKFIDAKKDLSIQLHPDDVLAKKRHDSFGKTEMWYVMQADNDAKLIVGFNQHMDKETYLKHLENKTLPQILNYHPVKEGDTYFIEAGRVHAIGAGVLLAEIQQTSDITYRVYDWDRTDNQGNKRQLHNDIAVDAFKFNLKEDYKVDYSNLRNRSNEMVSCPFFTTNFIEVSKDITKENALDSFIIYICVDGNCHITGDKHTEFLQKGETMLLPAAISKYTIRSKYAKLLEVYI